MEELTISVVIEEIAGRQSLTRWDGMETRQTSHPCHKICQLHWGHSGELTQGLSRKLRPGEVVEGVRKVVRLL